VVLPLFNPQEQESKWWSLSKLQKILAEQYKLEIVGS